jgi:hypothetical protein
MQLTKAKRHSIERLQQAIATIEEIVPQERRRSSQQRRKWLENAHEIFRVHCPKLALTAPSLSHFYNPEQFLENARTVADQLQQYATLVGGSAVKQVDSTRDLQQTLLFREALAGEEKRG